MPNVDVIQVTEEQVTEDRVLPEEYGSLNLNLDIVTNF